MFPVTRPNTPLSRAMGFRPTAEELADLIEEIDEDGSGAIEFPEFAQLCAKFLVEDPDPETMRAELKQAFRLFDKQGTVSRGWLQSHIYILDS